MIQKVSDAMSVMHNFSHLVFVLHRGVYMDGGLPVNPTQKPLLQMEFLVRCCYQTGGWVLDLCCGSGTAVIAALRQQLNVVALDIHPTQVAATQQRVQKFLIAEVSSWFELTAVAAIFPFDKA